MKKIVLLQNGLGNQMFIYAFYLALKKQFPDTWLSSYLFQRHCDHNGLEINRLFHLHWTEYPSARLVWFYRKCYYLSRSGNCLSFLFRGILKLLFHLHAGLCMEQPARPFPEERKRIRKPDYKVYWGGWMSEGWFSSIEAEIRHCYTFDRSMCSAKTGALLDELSASRAETVAVHVRRGDYAANPQYFDICNADYYRKALAVLSEKISAPCFYVFSDDIPWCRANLALPSGRVTFIDWNRKTDSWQDMYLMSKCKHNIIANSSFSWWAAWLNANKSKLVICPRQYSRTEDLVNVMPDSWLKV